MLKIMEVPEREYEVEQFDEEEWKDWGKKWILACPIDRIYIQE